MAEGKVELGNINYRQLLPWTELFRGFQLALDPKKLALAAGGILVMAIGWWLLALAFYAPYTKTPDFGDYGNDPAKWEAFKEHRRQWNVLHEAAGYDVRYTDAADLAGTLSEYNKVKEAYPSESAFKEGMREFTVEGKAYKIEAKPYGRLRTMPWSEDRGPNPYLLVTGQATAWKEGRFIEWLVTQQIPVLLEPLVKLIRPVVYLLHPDAGILSRFYFLLVILWTLATWAFFGGAITRMASVQIARNEKISMKEAVRFVVQRYVSFFFAPLFPLIIVAVMVVLLIVFGFCHMIPIFGDIVVDGVFWPLVLLAGLGMAVVLIGLVGWPMMFATISTEGSDSFDAISRSYSYIYQSPWQFIWYCLVATAYGAVLVFFIGFMGSLTVYLGKWAVSQTPFSGRGFTNRSPEFLFAYAPTSFQWRELLMQGAQIEGQELVRNGKMNPEAYDLYVGNKKPDGSYAAGSMNWWNHVGAWLVAFWTGLFFLLVLGFGYSYFWCASTMIYFLMRRSVDDTDLTEVYLEEEEPEESLAQTKAGTAITATAPAPGPNLTMIEAPTMRTGPPAPPPAPPPKTETSENITTGVSSPSAPSSPTPSATKGDGEAPPSEGSPAPGESS